ncbi:MAG: hypothetical protein ACODAB_03800 [Gemmatimonadota bacterium]
MRNRPASNIGPLTAALTIWAFSACAPGDPSSPDDTTGSILVEVSSGGVELPEGYEVAVDGGPAGGVGSNGSVTLQGIPPGTHAVELVAVPSNCAVGGENPRQTVIAEGGTSEVSFSVSCQAVPRGDISVTTTTSGTDLDPDGYEVSVDDRGATPIGLDDTATFPDLSVGDHQVELAGLASNCAIQGESLRVVPVADGQTTPTSFAVVCQALTGAIRVSVFTSGFFEDTDGYTVDLDGSRVETVEPDGSVTFDSVAPGDHTLTLGDIRSTCAVEGDNPTDATVAAGETVDVEFRVVCGF